MNHPFIQNNNIYKYLVAWLLISGIYALSLHFFYDFDWSIAIEDSLIFNLIFALFGLSYWFNIRYSPVDKSQVFNIAISHIVVGIISVSLGVFLSRTALMKLAPDEEYLLYLEDSLVWRSGLGVMYYAITILIYYLIIYYDDLANKNKQRAQLETMLKSSELEMLKYQINPHFIFNSLNSISSLTIISPERAREVIVKLSDFLRYSLGKDNHQMTTVKEELDNILLYLDIEKVRFGDRLKVETDIDEDSQHLQLPNLILQPLFENAIKHGIYESLEDVTINLNAKRDGDVLRLKVTNHYDPNAVTKKGKGIGLKNVRERLELIYSTPQLLHIEKTDNLFTVQLDIPQSISE